MKGLELSKRYYYEVGRPAIEERFPELMPHIAAGLCGQGSECFGFDDEISRDHDFGPGFILWLKDDLYGSRGASLQQLYDALPRIFCGIEREPHRRAGKRTGVFSVSGFFSRFIGNEQPPASKLRWLRLPGDLLAEAVNGEIFEDNEGEVTRLRESLMTGYPEEVRRKKLAGTVSDMAKTGQYNYARAMLRGDAVTAAIALSEFAKNAFRTIYLLNGRFAPYYKWLRNGAEGLPILGETAKRIDGLFRAQPEQGAWSSPKEPYRNLLDERVCIIETVCREVADELIRQGLSAENGDFLDDYKDAILAGIEDREIRLY